MQRKVILQRLWESHNQSTGVLIVIDENCQPVYIKPCIERGDRNNKRNVSNVPPNTYRLVKEYSPRFKTMLWELKEVPNRSECKIHPSNFWDQLNGCIAPGMNMKDIDNDGYYDVTSSRDATNEFHEALEDLTETTIEIRDPY